jgi:hypothetical protein
MIVTRDMVAALNPCYSAKQLEDAMVDGFNAGVCKVSSNDARWVLSRLLTSRNRIIWANESSKRARKYAGSCKRASAASAADSAARGEHSIAVAHALELIGQQ